MRWEFKTYTTSPHICRWMGFVVYNGPNLFSCEADGIVEADTLYEAATGLDPECKGRRMKGIMVTRLCPELLCNQPRGAR